MMDVIVMRAGMIAALAAVYTLLWKLAGWPGGFLGHTGAVVVYLATAYVVGKSSSNGWVDEKDELSLAAICVGLIVIGGTIAVAVLSLAGHPAAIGYVTAGTCVGIGGCTALMIIADPVID